MVGVSTVAEKIKKKVANLPDTPGVYFFFGSPKRGGGGSGNILYIGKATSLRSRVRSYFSGDILEKRSPLIAKMVMEARDINFEKTDSVLEALILEANLIKKHSPPFNTAEKDQKSWNFVVMTKEDFPQILLVRQREIEIGKFEHKIKHQFGPFTHGQELREALKIIRKIFPYRDNKCNPNQGRPCFNRQIGLCPGVCTCEVTKAEYAKTIRNIKLIFEGRKSDLMRSLQKEMKMYASGREFEKADETKRKIFTLKHIHDISLLRNSTLETQDSNFRIEAYDIAHISGTSVVGVMTVVEGGEVKKSDYRKFKISSEKNNDVAALREVLSRRLNHSEWRFPDLVVVDGGEAQLNVARAELESRGLNIPVSSVVKNERHKPMEIRGVLFADRKHEILLANSEAHRFAIKYHRNLRSRF
jgi:excinuclease ABC subunit C